MFRPAIRKNDGALLFSLKAPAVAALPPDVRKGSAFPMAQSKRKGYA
jgi:hypothetical protein